MALETGPPRRILGVQAFNPSHGLGAGNPFKVCLGGKKTFKRLDTKSMQSYLRFKVTENCDLRKRMGSKGKKGERSSELHSSKPIRFLN